MNASRKSKPVFDVFDENPNLFLGRDLEQLLEQSKEEGWDWEDGYPIIDAEEKVYGVYDDVNRIPHGLWDLHEAICTCEIVLDVRHGVVEIPDSYKKAFTGSKYWINS